MQRRRLKWLKWPADDGIPCDDIVGNTGIVDNLITLPFYKFRSARVTSHRWLFNLHRFTGEHTKSVSEYVRVRISHTRKLHLLHCISRVYRMWVASYQIVSPLFCACVFPTFHSIAQNQNDPSICIFVGDRTMSQTSKSRTAAAIRLITASSEHEGVSSQGESLECITAAVRTHPRFTRTWTMSEIAVKNAINNNINCGQLNMLIFATDARNAIGDRMSI